MAHAQLVKQVGRIKARVVRQLPRHALECLGVRRHDHLLLALDRACMLTQQPRKLHLDRAAACNNLVVLDCALHNHNGIVQASLNLGNHLLRTTAQHNGRCFGGGTPREDVVAVAANLTLFKQATRPELALRVNVRHGRLHRATDRLHNALHVVVRHAASAENVTVCKVLRRQIANWQARKHDLGARVHDRIELGKDDLPLGIDHCLVLGHITDAHLGVVLLGLQLELHVQAQHLGIFKALGLLLKACVCKRLLKCHAVNQHRVLHSTTRHLLDADQLLVQVRLV